MTYVIPEQAIRVSLPRRFLIMGAVAGAQILQRLSPKKLRLIMEKVSAGAVPASYQETRHTRDEVLSVSALCRGGKSCLVRSIATALVCRLHGKWPSWVVGVINVPPFAAHAWLEAEGDIVDEPLDRDDFTPFFRVSAKSWDEEASTASTPHT